MDEDEDDELKDEDEDEDAEEDEESEDEFEDDDMDTILAKLIIVTPKAKDRSRNTDIHKKSLNNEIATMINDGLYFYEQDLRRKVCGFVSYEHILIIFAGCTAICAQ